VPLQHPIKKGESVYIRLRWRVFGSGSLWRRTRLEPGVRVDFRVCDTREGIPSERDSTFLARILEVSSANVFVMAPGRLRPTNVSPAPKHIRTLEPGAWLDYLDGAAGWTWMARDLLVYGWHRKAEPEKPQITENDPFRVFLALNRPSGTPGWLHISYTAAGVLMALGLLNLLERASDFSVRDLDIKSWLGVIGVTSALAAWTFIQRLRTFTANRARRPRLLIRRCERFLLKL